MLWEKKVKKKNFFLMKIEKGFYQLFWPMKLFNSPREWGFLAPIIFKKNLRTKK